jgi:hypothetical protein
MEPFVLAEPVTDETGVAEKVYQTTFFKPKLCVDKLSVYYAVRVPCSGTIQRVVPCSGRKGKMPGYKVINSSSVVE